MSKHENHNHWNMYECHCYPEARADYEGIFKNLHEEYVALKGTILDLLQALDAEDQLKKGFGGMGYNILQETASGKNMHVRRLRSMIGEE